MFKKTNRKSYIESLHWSDIPPGSFIKTERGYFYVYSSDKRYSCLTTRVVESWSPQRIIECSEKDAAVKKLKIISKLKFRNGSLLYSHADGKMYLVSENKLRHITSPDVLTLLGAKRSDAVWVSNSELALHQLGENLGS